MTEISGFLFHNLMNTEWTLRLRNHDYCIVFVIVDIPDLFQYLIHLFNFFKYRLYEIDYATHKQGQVESLIKFYFGFKIKSGNNILHQNLNL